MNVASLLSRAFCAGLIEALGHFCLLDFDVGRYPVRFARASLKQLRCASYLDPVDIVIPCVLRGPH